MPGSTPPVSPRPSSASLSDAEEDDTNSSIVLDDTLGFEVDEDGDSTLSSEYDFGGSLRDQYTLSIPGDSDYLNHQQITLLQTTLEKTYIDQHPEDAIIVQAPDPQNANIIQSQDPILPVYDASDTLRGYVSYGDSISKIGSDFTVEHASSRISHQFNRMLSALILSTVLIPDALSCYFAINHGGHWTSLVIQTSIGIVEKGHLMELRSFFNHLQRPYSLRDYSTVANLLLVIGGQNTETLFSEFFTQIKIMESFHDIVEINDLITTLKASDTNPPDHQKGWFVPFYKPTQITLMDSFMVHSDSFCNQAISVPLRKVFPEVPLQILPVPEQGPNHCGDNTIWNGFHYAASGQACTAPVSGALRELTIQACKAKIAWEDQTENFPALEADCSVRANRLIELIPPLSSAQRPMPTLIPAPAPTPADHSLPLPTTITTPLLKDLKSRYLTAAGLSEYLRSSFHLIKVFLIAVFSLNIFGLGFRKFLMARKLRQELLNLNNTTAETETLIQQYDDYNTYLENHKPLWLENFRSIHPEKKKYDLSDCEEPTNSAFYKALRH